LIYKKEGVFLGMIIEDPKAALQVITCLYNSPSLLDDTGKYFFKKQDFPNEFHRVLLRTIQRLHDNGIKVITLQTFEDKISNYPEEYAIYKAHNGAQWIIDNKDIAQLSGFDYYYSRLKKFTLLREYQNIGCDVRKVYDPNEIFDAK
jgi:replicative DNA helicase